MAKYHQLIKNAKIINGTASPWFISDVAISGHKIVAVGKLKDEDANEVIDAGFNYLAPGFIDTHTHDDIIVLREGNHEAKLLQGVTTIVTGNCSFSNYPTVDSNDYAREQLASLLGQIKNEEMCEDFVSYKNLLTKSKTAINIVSLVGHGPIRLAIMGFQKRDATKCEIEKMCQLLEKQLKQGAHGLSLGLIYPPSSFANFEELVSLANVVRKYDKILAAHIRCYNGKLIESINEFISILRLSGAKGLLSHLQISGRPYWGQMQKALDIIEEARNSGVDISLDMYPYTAGSTTILQLLPPSAHEGGINQLLQKLNDPTYYSKLCNLIEFEAEPGWEPKIPLIGWENILIGSVTAQELKCIEGKFVPEAASIFGMKEIDFILHAIRVDSGTSNIIMFQQSPEDQKTVHSSRLQMVGSDGIPRDGGKPHPRLYGTFARVIGRLAANEKLMPLEEAIRRMTSLPAQRFQLYDRGIIVPGLVADLVLFSNQFIDAATYDEPKTKPIGLMAVWVNGKCVVNQGNIINNTFDGKVL